jgi:hypothetical protein
MKNLLLAVLFLSSTAFAVTPQEYREIVAATKTVIAELTYGSRNPTKLISIVNIDELGSRAKVTFTFTEEFYGKKECSFDYNLSTKAVVDRSWLCR